MHRALMKTPRGKKTDHINGDRLDNRKSNLRICTNKQNARNNRKQSNASSKYKGVTYYRESRNYKAQINADYKVRHLGMFDNERHAALAYDLWAIDLFGEYAGTNFSIVAHSSFPPALNN